MSLHSIIYLSSATEPLTPQELRDLLDLSRRNNAAVGIGGILLHWDGNFLQYIEGPEKQLELLMAKVTQDPRHDGIIVVHREAIEERAFPDWTMAFESIKVKTDGESDYLSSGALDAAPGNLSPTASRLIESFREHIR